MTLLTEHDLRQHHPFPWICVGLLAVMAVAFWIIGHTGASLGTGAALAGCIALMLPPRERMAVLPRSLQRLPRIYDAAPVMATLLSTPGYGLGWFYLDGPYDEIVHLANGILAGGVLLALIRRRERRTLHLLMVGTGFGLLLGTAWEVFEAITGLIGDWTDTWTDVVLTAAGAGLGVTMADRWPALRPDPHRTRGVGD
ncbi:hypothetical protein ACFOD4_21460 [Pseudoroseomonas globiformis]|uniref:VanZ family protein n=1 Tax=Teichococcus globiformis TaxID=2307229 RepID=A0ABV7G7Z1_9PROT